MFEGRDVWMPAGPSAYRLRALATIGWSPAVLGKRYGANRETLDTIRNYERPAVRRSNHEKIKRMYKDLSMTPAPLTNSTSRVRSFARSRGWLSPMELDEGMLRE